MSKMRMKIMMGRLYGRDIRTRPQTNIGHFWVWMADCVVWCGAVRCSYPIRMEAKDAVWTALADWMYLRRMQQDAKAKNGRNAEASHSPASRRRRR